MFQFFLSVFHAKKMWIWMARKDITSKYRGSLLGPFWIVINLVVLVSFLSYIYSQIFNLDINIYVPYVALGFISWYLISGTMIECSKSFIDNASLIRNFSYTPLIYIFKVVTKNLILFKYNLMIYLAIAFIFNISLNIKEVLFFIPGIIVNIFILLEIGVLLAIPSTRYRDIPHMIENILLLAMFITPVLFFADMVGNNRFIIDVNPFYHMIEVLRQPLLGQKVNTMSWIYLICLAMILLPITIYSFKRNCRKIAYWV
jgi:ABC-2 type transport system permease protein